MEAFYMRIRAAKFLTVLSIIVSGTMAHAQTSPNRCRLAVFTFDDNRSLWDRDESTQRSLLAVNTLSYGIDTRTVKNAGEVSEGEYAMTGVIHYLDSSFGHLNPGTYTNVVVMQKKKEGFIILARGVTANFSRFVFEDLKQLNCQENGSIISPIQ